MLYTYLQIIINVELPDIVRTSATWALKDPDVYKRISRQASSRNFDKEVVFDVLPWFLNVQMEIIEVPVSPEPEVVKDDDEEKEDSDGEIDNDDVDGYDHVSDYEIVHDENVVENVAHDDEMIHEMINDNVADDKIVQQVIHEVHVATPPITPDHIQTCSQFIPSLAPSPIHEPIIQSHSQPLIHDPYIPEFVDPPQIPLPFSPFQSQPTSPYNEQSDHSSPPYSPSLTNTNTQTQANFPLQETYHHTPPTSHIQTSP